MPHWLEEAEKNQYPESESLPLKERIQTKKLSIQENYAQFQKPYEAFIEELHELVMRVNNLPAAKRIPFGKLVGREKESKLDNHLNIFSSSQRINKSGFLGFLPFVRTNHFKHIRVLYLYISDKPGLIHIEVKENILLRDVVRTEKQGKEKSGGHRKFHVVYYFPIEKLDHQMGLEIIDWLAFRKDVSDCLFYKLVPEDEKHFT